MRLTSSPRLRVHLLGEMQISLDGAPLQGKSYGKLQALLAFLAVESDRAHRRVRLAELLWPALDPEAARSNLRQTLYNLRRLLGSAGDVLKAERDTVKLTSGGPFWLDVHAFIAGASADAQASAATDHGADALAEMERAAALYRGEFLADVALGDAPDFDEWRAAWRETLSRRALALLERLWQRYEQRGQPERALLYARRYVELEPWDEEGQRQLMRLLALNGQRGAAQAQYEACRAMLARELQVLPEAATRQLFEAIRDGQLSMRAPAGQRDGAGGPTEPAAGRRQATVLHCSLAVAHETDPEEIADRLRVPHRTCIDIVGQHGGYVVPTDGGTVLAYFGYPSAFEDAARQAVRAALALAETAGREAVERRIGLHTGIIITGDDPRVPDTAGVTSRVAMRLCDHAGAGEVVISEATGRLVDGYFRLEAREPLHLADKSPPVRTFHVDGETGACSRLDAASRLLPLVGRRAELAALESLWAEARQGRTRWVVLSGDAGLGKSRLLRALREGLSGTQAVVRELNCQSEFSQTPFYPIVDLIERLLAFGPDDALAAKRAKLDAYLRRHHDTLRSEAYPLLTALLGIADEATPLPPDKWKEKTLAILPALLFDTAEERPLLVAVEDLHWADPSTLAVLEAAAGRDRPAPVLSVYTTRPATLPSWLADSGTLLHLAPLADEEVEMLVRHAEAALPPEVVRRIVDRADGVPLFAEEMAHTAIEPTAHGDIPPTLKYLLLARLDAMPAGRRTAQIAATVGREFGRDLLRHLVPLDETDLDRDLAALAEARLIVAAGGSGHGFQFRHALFQEAAYRSQGRADRMAAHRRVADALIAHFPQRAAQQPEQMARHFTSAGSAAEAIPWWLAAGRSALRANANSEAADHLETGLALVDRLPSGQARDALERALLLALGQAMLRLRGYGSAEAAAVYDRAFTLCHEGDASSDRFEALWGLWMVSSSRTEAGFAASAALTRKLLTSTEAAGQPFLRSYATSAAANVALWQGKLEEACRYADAAINDFADPTPGDQRPDGHDPRVAGYAYTSWARFAQGRILEATDASERGIALARGLNHPDSLCFALVHAATMRRLMRDIPKAVQLAEEALALATQYGLPLWQGATATVIGWAQARNGDAEGLELLKASAAGVRQIMPGILVAFLHPLAEAYGFFCDAEAQLQVVEEGLAAAARLDESFHLPDLHRIRGECLERIGRVAEAEAALTESLRISEAQGARAFQLRAAVALAVLFHRQRRYPDATAVLSPIIAAWGEGEATIDLQTARELMKRDVDSYVL